MSKRMIVIVTALLAMTIFVGGASLYSRSVSPPDGGVVTADTLIRRHSPLLGPEGAPVTIVEFFDPSCEACRAFYPITKQIMAAFPNDVRLILRYAPLHEGSDVVVRILEAARMQGMFIPVLEAILAKQPEWAVHGAPDLEKAWRVAESAGLNLQQARTAAFSEKTTSVLDQDIADMRANGVNRTPSFFVNGKGLSEFGPQQLYELVAQQVDETRKPRYDGGAPPKIAPSVPSSTMD